MTTVHLLLEAWPVLIMIVGLIGAVSVALYRLAQIERRVSGEAARLEREITALQKSVDERLFLHGGELRYVTSTLCGNMRESCGAHITDNFTALSAKLAQMEKRWEKVLERLAGGFSNKN